MCVCCESTLATNSRNTDCGIDCGLKIFFLSNKVKNALQHSLNGNVDQNVVGRNHSHFFSFFYQALDPVYPRPLVLRSAWTQFLLFSPFPNPLRRTQFEFAAENAQDLREDYKVLFSLTFADLCFGTVFFSRLRFMFARQGEMHSVFQRREGSAYREFVEVSITTTYLLSLVEQRESAVGVLKKFCLYVAMRSQYRRFLDSLRVNLRSNNVYLLGRYLRSLDDVARGVFFVSSGVSGYYSRSFNEDHEVLIPPVSISIPENQSPIQSSYDIIDDFVQNMMVEYDLNMARLFVENGLDENGHVLGESENYVGSENGAPDDDDQVNLWTYAVSEQNNDEESYYSDEEEEFHSSIGGNIDTDDMDEECELCHESNSFQLNILCSGVLVQHNICQGCFYYFVDRVLIRALASVSSYGGWGIEYEEITEEQFVEYKESVLSMGIDFYADNFDSLFVGEDNGLSMTDVFDRMSGDGFHDMTLDFDSFMLEVGYNWHLSPRQLNRLMHILNGNGTQNVYMAFLPSCSGKTILCKDSSSMVDPDLLTEVKAAWRVFNTNPNLNIDFVVAYFVNKYSTFWDMMKIEKYILMYTPSSTLLIPDFPTFYLPLITQAALEFVSNIFYHPQPQMTARIHKFRLAAWFCDNMLGSQYLQRSEKRGRSVREIKRTVLCYLAEVAVALNYWFAAGNIPMITPPLALTIPLCGCFCDSYTLRELVLLPGYGWASVLLPLFPYVSPVRLGYRILIKHVKISHQLWKEFEDGWNMMVLACGHLELVRGEEIVILTSNNVEYPNCSVHRVLLDSNRFLVENEKGFLSFVKYFLGIELKLPAAFHLVLIDLDIRLTFEKIFPSTFFNLFRSKRKMISLNIYEKIWTLGKLTSGQQLWNKRQIDEVLLPDFVFTEHGPQHYLLHPQATQKKYVNSVVTMPKNIVIPKISGCGGYNESLDVYQFQIWFEAQYKQTMFKPKNISAKFGECLQNRSSFQRPLGIKANIVDETFLIEDDTSMPSCPRSIGVQVNLKFTGSVPNVDFVRTNYLVGNRIFSDVSFQVCLWDFQVVGTRIQSVIVDVYNPARDIVLKRTVDQYIPENFMARQVHQFTMVPTELRSPTSLRSHNCYDVYRGNEVTKIDEFLIPESLMSYITSKFPKLNESQESYALVMEFVLPLLTKVTPTTTSIGGWVLNPGDLELFYHPYRGTTEYLKIAKVVSKEIQKRVSSLYSKN